MLGGVSMWATDRIDCRGTEKAMQLVGLMGLLSIPQRGNLHREFSATISVHARDRKSQWSGFILTC